LSHAVVVLIVGLAIPAREIRVLLFVSQGDYQGLLVTVLFLMGIPFFLFIFYILNSSVMLKVRALFASRFCCAHCRQYFSNNHAEVSR
jgi:hypothetical protein